ncbi:MAG TPA: hypothetical protein VF251_08270, partial [Pyrinomonadaceae bacterium]
GTRIPSRLTGPLRGNYLIAMRVVRFLLITMVVSIAFQAIAQQPTSWKRVYTGDGYVIDLNLTSVEFGSDQTLRTQIRTVLQKEESVEEVPGAKSKTRLEQLEYKLHNGDYRITEVVLLDSAGKSVHKQHPDAAVWKPLKPGGMMERILLATRPALPFGKWKVAAYRLATGEDTRSSDDVTNFIGVSVSLEAQLAKVDQSVCGNPVYKSEHYTIIELSRRLGTEIKLPEVQSDRVDLIYVKCEKDGWEPPQSMLVKLPEGRMLMLWKGVFLTLKRT